MRMIKRIRTSKTLGPVVLWLILLLVLLWMPTGYESAMSYKNAERVDALVLSTNESDIADTVLLLWKVLIPCLLILRTCFRFTVL